MNLELAKKIVKLNEQIEESEERIKKLEQLVGGEYIEIIGYDNLAHSNGNSIIYSSNSMERLIAVLTVDDKTMIKRWKTKLELL